VFDVGDRAEPGMYVDATPPSYLRRDGSEVVLDVSRDPVQTGTVLTLLDERVAGARSEDGVLHITFADGSELRSPASDEYESWKVVGNRRVFQCLPGGEVASW
jgi:hypothetical protein